MRVYEKMNERFKKELVWAALYDYRFLRAGSITDSYFFVLENLMNLIIVDDCGEFKNADECVITLECRADKYTSSATYSSKDYMDEEKLFRKRNIFKMNDETPFSLTEYLSAIYNVACELGHDSCWKVDKFIVNGKVLFEEFHESPRCESERHYRMGKERMVYGMTAELYLNEFFKANPEFEKKCDRISNYIKSQYKKEFQEFYDYRYQGMSGWIMTDLSYELRNYGPKDEKLAYKFLKKTINEDYDKLFKNDVVEIRLSEEDDLYLKESISDKAYKRLMRAIEGYNNGKKENPWVDSFYLTHAWDTNYCNGRYDDLIYGGDIDKIKDIMRKYGFHHSDYELDRKTVEDKFCCAG